MASAAPSGGQIILYVILPIISFVIIAMLVYFCYRKRRCCFSTKEEALLGNAEKNRFTVDMGKRKRRSDSLNSISADSFESKSNGYHQTPTSGRSRQHLNNNYEKAIISSGIPRPDIKRSGVVGQAGLKNVNLLSGPYQPSLRATSPAQSLTDFYHKSSATDVPLTGDACSRHHSYDAAVSGRRISESVVYNTISEGDIQRNILDSSSNSLGVFASDENLSKKSPSNSRRLRHQGRVKGKEDEPSFSRPTRQPRVSLIISSASFNLSSSEESDNEVVDITKPKRHSSSSSSTEKVQQKRSRSKGELHPIHIGKSSGSADRGDRSPSVQYSGRSSPAVLEAVDEVEAGFKRRSPNIRSSSSPVGTQQNSLDMNALQAALSHHRRSDGDVLAHGRGIDEDSTRFHSDGLRRENTTSQSSLTGGRRTGAGTSTPYTTTPSLSVTTDAYPGRQGRRRSSMQMPIDLSQINPKLYMNLVAQPSTDVEEDVELPQIHFTLDYNHDLEVLTVKLIQARNLKTQAFSGTCDPYCTVAIVPGFNARQSKVHRRTTDPEFEEKFAFSINQDDMLLKTLEIRTYDFDQFSRDECTGVTEMKLDAVDFELTSHYDLWKKFRVEEDLQASQAAESCGDLLLALSYLPSAEKLTVVIQKARNLKSPEGRKGSPDPYIKVSIFRGTQRLKKKKTDTIQSTYNPVFNQALTFSVSPELLQCPLLRITCQAVHDQKLAANAELGHLEIGPGAKEEEERMHWRDVTGKHSNKPVARWHKLHTPENNTEESKSSFLNLANARRFSSTVLFPQNEKSSSGRVSPPERRSLT